MPLYTAITQEGTVSSETKAKMAEEITRIHTSVMKVPKNFVRVVFLSYPKGSGFTGGSEAATATLNCVLRSGHTVQEKADMLKQLFQLRGRNGSGLAACHTHLHERRFWGNGSWWRNRKFAKL